MRLEKLNQFLNERLKRIVHHTIRSRKASILMKYIDRSADANQTNGQMATKFRADCEG